MRTLANIKIRIPAIIVSKSRKLLKMVTTFNNSSTRQNGGISNTNITVTEALNGLSDGLSLETKLSILCIILTFALLGNVILIVSILKTPRMRKSLTNQLILNLALCDVVIVITGIPGEIINQTLGTWVLGEIGCRLLYPVSTYAVIAAVTTLLMIGVDRFFAASYPFRYRTLKSKSHLTLGIVHVYALACVVPYAFHLTLTEDDGVIICDETWSDSTSTIYTIFLFVIQYGAPLPIIVALYAKTWIRIKHQNDSVIKNAESMHRGSKKRQDARKRESGEYARQSLLSVDNNSLAPNHSTRRRSRSLLDAIRESFISLTGEDGEHSHKYVSQTAIDRHKQTTKLLKLFICVILVFAVCMLPYHIIWLNIAITGKSLLSNETHYLIAYLLTYVNSVINPIIYGIHPRFRILYKNCIKEVLNCCTNVCFKRQFYETEEIRGSTADSVYSVWTPETFRKRISRTFSTGSKSSLKKRNKSRSDSLPKNGTSRRRSKTVPPTNIPVKKRSLTIPQITVTDIEHDIGDVFTDENRVKVSVSSSCSSENDDVFVTNNQALTEYRASFFNSNDEGNSKFDQRGLLYIDKDFVMSREGLLLLETMSESDC
uniref:G-protein coupled receptors family 1 profile domain-containing protein n=1 Tax=Clytia hemisphaerica TaxID=252671 RepID=A0A7M5V4W9_9CNID